MKEKESKPVPLAVVCGDVHLQSTTPSCRKESDWFGVMEQGLGAVLELSTQYEVPVLCAGDLFDRWNSSVELAHFALLQLRKFRHGFFCIPGQHDLPYHNLSQCHKSIYGLMKWCDTFFDLTSYRECAVLASSLCQSMEVAPFSLAGFPWGFSKEDLIRRTKTREVQKVYFGGHTALRVALVHHYVWSDAKNCHLDGDPLGNVQELAKVFRAFDVVICGDNHIPFECRVGNTLFYNCGPLFVRRSDEAKLRPSVGILYSDGTVKRKKLQVPAPEMAEKACQTVDVSTFLEQFTDHLERVSSQQDYTGLRYEDILEIELSRVSQTVRTLILRSLENHTTK